MAGACGPRIATQGEGLGQWVSGGSGYFHHLHSKQKGLGCNYKHPSNFHFKPYCHFHRFVDSNSLIGSLISFSSLICSQHRLLGAPNVRLPKTAYYYML